MAVVRVVVALLVVALADIAAAATETLDRQQAVARSLQSDPRIDERRRLVELARAQLREAEGSDGVIIDFNGFLGASPGVNGGFFIDNSCTSPAGCQIRDDRYGLNDGLSLWNYLALTVVKPLYTFGKIENYAIAAQANIEVKQGDVRMQRGETILDVNRAYFGFLAARDGRLFMENIEERVDAAIELVEAWLEKGQGEVTQADLYALKAGKALVAQNVAQARGLERVSLEGLKVLTGLDRGTDLAVADNRIAPLPMPEQELQALQEAAMVKRPEITQLEHGLKARRALVTAKKAMARPNVYLGFSGILSYSPNRDRLDNPHLYDPFNDYGVTPMIGLKWDWQPAVQAAQTDQAQAELDALIAKAALARRGIPFQVAEQFYTLQANREAVDKLAQGSRDARRWMITAYADFEAGVGKADPIVTAMQGYVLAHTEYLRSVFEYNMNVVQLEHTIGAYE